MKKLHTLHVSKKGNKFLYEVKDENGVIVCSRSSKNPNYLAATTDGRFYFGRLDLIGKGDHGRALKNDPETYSNIAYRIGFAPKNN